MSYYIYFQEGSKLLSPASNFRGPVVSRTHEWGKLRKFNELCAVNLHFSALKHPMHPMFHQHPPYLPYLVTGPITGPLEACLAQRIVEEYAAEASWKATKQK